MSLICKKPSDDKIQMSVGDTKRMLNKSFTYFNQGYYCQALTVCEELYVVKPSNEENLVRLGAIHLQLRNFHESIFYCKQCLRIEPECCEAYSIIGNCFKELGDTTAALASFDNAIRIRPDCVDAYNNLACALFQIGKQHDALDTLKVAIKMNPTHTDLICNMGNIYNSLAEHEKAKKYYHEAIRVNPKCAIAWSNLGVILDESKEHSRAIDCYKRALQIMPDFADAYSNMGNAIQNLSGGTNKKILMKQAKSSFEWALHVRPDFAKGRGNFAIHNVFENEYKAEIIKNLHEALRLDPNYIDVLNNLAGYSYDVGQMDQCIMFCLQVLQKKPDHVQAYNILGNALKKKSLSAAATFAYSMANKVQPSFAPSKSSIGAILLEDNKIETSLQHLSYAIKFDPLLKATHTNMGNAYATLHQTNYAIECYKNALSIDPDDSKNYYNLAVIFQRKGDFEYALKYVNKALVICDNPAKEASMRLLIFLKAVICDWSDSKEDHEILKNVTLNNHTVFTQPLSLQSGVNFDTELDHKYGVLTNRNKIKIGYIISAHGYKNRLRHIPTMHDNRKFEVFCFHCFPLDMELYTELADLKGARDHIIDICDVSRNSFAKLILGMNIDVLVDLNESRNESISDKLFFARPLPIQIGMCSRQSQRIQPFDYIVINEYMMPLNYNEKVMCVPDIFINPKLHELFTNNRYRKPGNLRAQYNISDDAFVYGCFNQPYAIDSKIFGVWMSILKNAGDMTVLVLLKHSDRMERRLKNEAEIRGISPDRLIFISYRPFEEHINRYSFVDLYLDTASFGGKSTVAEAFYSGTPTICIAGNEMLDRVGASILKSLKFDDLVVENLVQYEQLAISLQVDEETFVDILRRLDILRATSSFLNPKHWMRNYEKSIEKVVEIL